MNQKIQLKIKEHVKRSGLTQRQFAKEVNLREAVISQMVNNKYDRIELKHLLTLMQYLKTKDFNDMLEIVNDDGSPIKPIKED